MNGSPGANTPYNPFSLLISTEKLIKKHAEYSERCLHVKHEAVEDFLDLFTIKKCYPIDSDNFFATYVEFEVNGHVVPFIQDRTINDTLVYQGEECFYHTVTLIDRLFRFLPNSVQEHWVKNHFTSSIESRGLLEHLETRIRDACFITAQSIVEAHLCLSSWKITHNEPTSVAFDLMFHHDIVYNFQIFDNFDFIYLTNGVSNSSRLVFSELFEPNAQLEQKFPSFNWAIYVLDDSMFSKGFLGRVLLKHILKHKKYKLAASFDASSRINAEFLKSLKSTLDWLGEVKHK